MKSGNGITSKRPFLIPKLGCGLPCFFRYRKCQCIFYTSFKKDKQILITGLYRVPSGGISTFGPLIIKGFGYDQFKTILFNMPFGAVQLVATMGGAYIAMIWKLKAPVLMFLSIPPIIGCVMLLVLSHDAAHKGPLLVGYYLVSILNFIRVFIYLRNPTRSQCTPELLL